ncbi:MAG: metallophosphoesterase [Chlamydiales bacterium]
MKNVSLRVIHISDPHFSHITYNPKQFLTKRWLGNCNLILFRQKAYQTRHLVHIPELVEQLAVEAVFITGDFSTTSIDEEFVKAKEFVKEFEKRNLPVYCLPGNHDCYTKEAERSKRFYHHFPSEGLKNNRIEKVELGKGWWWIGLDCALATSLIRSNGYFFPEMEKSLEKALSQIPSDENVIIGNHFPLYGSGRPRHDLARGQALREMIKRYPQVKLYLHGHDHTPYIIEKREENLPLVLNSGSCAHQPKGTFYLLELDDKGCLVQRFFFRKEDESFSWVVDWQKQFKFYTISEK